MKIAVISDTHIHKSGEKMAELINRCFSDVDMIIHAGDYTDKRVVEVLKKFKNFVGVWGNVDKDSIKSMLKEKEIVEACGLRIGIFHGHGEKKTTIERAYDIFRDDRVDIIIYGHSHQPCVTTKDKILMLNPGSITYKRQERWHSYIIINTDKNMMDVSFKFFN